MNPFNQQHKILGTFYYSEILSTNGDKNLHEWLTALYKPVYDNNERLVIVQDCADQYPIFEAPGRALELLQKFLIDLDISNNFVLVVSGDENVQDDINTLRKQYANDHALDPIDFLHDNTLEKFDREYQTSDTFCALPWIHFHVGPDSAVRPCCTANLNRPVGHLSITPIDDILNSERYTTLRNNMLLGRRSRECTYCYELEDQNLVSPRQESNQRWNLDRKRLLNTVPYFAPRYIDIRLSNTCNLKCRMCDGFFSSAIAQENFDLYGHVRLNETNKTRSKNLDLIKSCLGGVEKIYFAGGEPLLMSEHYEILKELIKIGNTNCEITYNTNFTNLKFKGNSVLKLWSHFPNVVVGASLDAHGAVAEYVRHGTNWSEIENNYEQFRNTCSNVKFLVCSTVGLMNVSSLIELQTLWHQRWGIDIDNFEINVLITPSFMSLRVLPEHHKQRIKQRILQHQDWLRSVGSKELVQSWQNVLSYMISKDDSHLLEQFRKNTQRLDQHRKESFAAVLPEYHDLI